MSRFCKDIVVIFKAAVNAVKPEHLIEKSIQIVHPGYLNLYSKTFKISQNVHIVGFGKAVFGMAATAERILGNDLVSGIISVPKGISEQMKEKGLPCFKEDSKVQVFEGASNNLPDKDAMNAAEAISLFVKTLSKGHLLLVLISGGGSSLLPLPVPEISLEEKLEATKLLFSKGATIQEINVVRKRLSQLKGGGLAKAAAPAQVVSLILSDIVGDPLDLIASGPTVQNTDDVHHPLQIINKYKLTDTIPPNVISALKGISPDTDDSAFDHVTNFVIGSNKVAILAAEQESTNLNYTAVILTTELQGVAHEVGTGLARLAYAVIENDIAELNKQFNVLSLPPESKTLLLAAASKNRNICLLLGGETVVKIKGQGKGGRNQELALAASLELHKLQLKEDNAVILSAGTDGIDGPTLAAGAIATSGVIDTAITKGLDASEFLKNNDSFSFYEKVNEGKFHVFTGHTGTNVMDIIVILLSCR